MSSEKMTTGSAQPARGGFATNFGFILAAAGSAVGLGNIWKFPYITGVYGGGAFVLVYLGCIALVGLPLMYAEMIIGRRGGKDILGAMRSLAGDSIAGKILSTLTGGLGILAGFLILSFYAVVAGWSLNFLMISLSAIPGTDLAASTNFESIAGSGWMSAFWHTLFMGMTIMVVVGGIHGGIEKLCNILMPTLFVILFGLLGYVFFEHREGLNSSLAFMFQPDFGKLSGEAVLEALGHAFFTLSLGMGAMVTYGSYLQSDRNVIRDGVAVAFLDTLIALLAGVVIFAVVFSFGHDAGAGPGLVFATLPSMFVQMPGGAIISSIFFLLLVFAAWSSAVSLLEVVVAYFVDERGWSRKTATWSMGGLIWLLGLASAVTITSSMSSPTEFVAGVRENSADLWNWVRSNPPNVLDMLDNLTTRYMLPIGGLLIAIGAGWFIPKEDRNAGYEQLGALGRPLSMIWLVTIRFITPLLVIAVILHKMEVLNDLLKLVGLPTIGA